MPKKFIPLLLTTIISLLPTLISSATIDTGRPRVVLDPGHGGGSDTGIKAPSGTEEQAVTWKLATLIAEELSDTVHISLTRTPGESSTPIERTTKANQSGSSLFIGLHLHRQAPDESYVFYPRKTGIATTEKSDVSTRSKRMAELAARHLGRLPGARPHIRTAPLTSAKGLLMPAILVEPFSAYQTPEDPAEQPAQLMPYARAIAAAITAYFK